MPSASRRRSAAPALALTGLALLAAACSDTTGLPGATVENAVATVELFALSDDSVALPSAYVLDGARRVWTNQSSVFDFAFDFDSQGRAVLLSTYAASPTLGKLSSLQRATVPFDSVTIAPTGRWVYDSAFVVEPGSVLLVRSRPTSCITGITVSLYAKLRVVTVDAAAQRLEFEILVDQNCGYRGLEPGLPKR